MPVLVLSALVLFGAFGVGPAERRARGDRRDGGRIDPGAAAGIAERDDRRVIPAAVTFGEVQGAFSDACNRAIVFGKDTILKPDWKRLFEPEEIVASVERITRRRPSHRRHAGRALVVVP